VVRTMLTVAIMAAGLGLVCCRGRPQCVYWCADCAALSLTLSRSRDATFQLWQCLPGALVLHGRAPRPERIVARLRDCLQVWQPLRTPFGAVRGLANTFAAAGHDPLNAHRSATSAGFASVAGRRLVTRLSGKGTKFGCRPADADCNAFVTAVNSNRL
jgi:hypothetical protein